MLDAKVIPLLFGLEQSDLSGPLSQFQAQKVEEQGLMEVVKAINKVAVNKAADSIVTQLVPTLWQKFQQELKKVPVKNLSERQIRPQHDILEELVTGVRGLNNRMREFDLEASSREIRDYKRKSRWQYPMLIDEILQFSCNREDHPISLLVIAGLLRNDFPWLAEIFTESYREIRDGNAESAERVLFRLTRTIKTLMRGPLMEEMSGGSKDAFVFARDLPRLVDRAIRPMLKQAEPVEPEKGDREGQSSLLD